MYTVCGAACAINGATSPCDWIPKTVYCLTKHKKPVESSLDCFSWLWLGVVLHIVFLERFLGLFRKSSRGS